MIVKILLLIVIFGMVMLAIGIYDGNRFVVVSHTFCNEKIREDFSFALITDLHNQRYGRSNERIWQALEKANPDMILIAGDLLTSQKNQNTEETTKLMQDMCKRWQVYYAMGNHETKLMQYADVFGNQFESFLDATQSENRHILQNNRVYLERYNLDICGLELTRTYYKRLAKKELPENHLTKLLGEANQDAFQILLAHNPEYFEQYAAWGADMVLSGHVHGGIMKLPILGGVISPSLRLFPKYDGGVFEVGKSVMLLSRGMGTHTIPLRFFNPAELHIVTMKRHFNDETSSLK